MIRILAVVPETTKHQEHLLITSSTKWPLSIGSLLILPKGALWYQV